VGLGRYAAGVSNECPSAKVRPYECRAVVYTITLGGEDCKPAMLLVDKPVHTLRLYCRQREEDFEVARLLIDKIVHTDFPGVKSHVLFTTLFS
jgi:hypothetical protein